MVGEDEVGREFGPHGSGVQLDVALALARRQVGQQASVEPFVAVEHEHRQQAADLRPHVPRAAEVVLLGARLLREDDHLVPGAAPLARERTRVDVRPGPAEQVPVPENDLQTCLFPTGPRDSPSGVAKTDIGSS